MSDFDLRTLERRVREGGDDLDHARLFSALWKRDAADLFIYVMELVYEGPSSQVRFELQTTTKPQGLRVPVVLTMKKLDVRPEHQWTTSHPRIDITWSSARPPKKAVDVKWHAAWDRTRGGWDPGYTIRTISGETTWATVKDESPDVAKEWTFYPMVRPAEIPT